MPKIRLIANLCPHYRVKLFEYLNSKTSIHFTFYSEGNESYWNKRIPLTTKGNFVVEGLRGVGFGSTLRLITGLINLLLFDKSKVVIKCINGKAALPITFILTKIRKKKFILWTGVWSHPETMIHKLTFPIARFIYNHSDAIIVYGEHVKKYLINLGVREERIFIGWQTVDNNKFDLVVPEESKQIIREKLHAQDRIIVLSIGRLVEEKGYEYLIKAVSLTQNKKIIITLIGNGKLEKELMQFAKLKEVDLQIIEYVPNESIVEYIAACDLFVLPSVTTKHFKEPWGLVVNEVMLQRKPIIVTDAVGASVGGLISNGSNGIIVPEKKADELANAISRVVAKSDYATNLGTNAYNAVKGWTYNRMGDQFLKAIEYVINNGQGFYEDISAKAEDNYGNSFIK